MKTFSAILAVLFLVGCASTNSLYYEAVQKTAEANAKAAQAKFDALSKIASSGDGQAASAAVMALALTQTSNAQPIPQKSEAIQWASILASPVTSLGMMWMQADSAKTLARYNTKVDIARVAAESADNQALYAGFSDMATAGFTAMGNVDYTPFVDGLVDLGNAGIDGAVTLGTAGFDANVELGTAGIDGVVDMGTAGVDGLVDVATTGITGVVGLGTVGYETMLIMDQGNNALTDSVWSEYVTSIQEIMANLPNVVCSATGGELTSSVTCD